MRIKSIRLHNFMSFGEENNTLDFDDLFKDAVDFEDRVALICGIVDGDPNKSNGAGKSTLLDAICYLFFERLPRIAKDRGRKGFVTDAIIRTDDENKFVCDEAYVEAYVEAQDGINYRIRRGRKLNKKRTRHSPILEIEACDGESLSARSKERPDETISEMAGGDCDSFVNSRMFVQRDLGGVLKGSPRSRQDMLGQLFGLSVIDDMLAITRGQNSTNSTDLTATEATLGVLKDQLDKLDESDLNRQAKEMKKLEQDAKKKQSDAENQVKAIDVTDIDKTIDDLVKEGAGLESELSMLADKEVAEAAKLEATIKEMRESLQRQLKLKRAYDDSKTDIQLKRAKITREMDSIDKDATRDLYDEIKAAKETLPAKKEALSKLRSELSEASSDVASVGKEIEIKEKELERFTSLVEGGSDDGVVVCPTCTSEVQSSHISEQHIEPLTGEIKTLRSSLAKAGIRREKAVNEIGKISEEVEILQATVDRLPEVTSTVDKFKSSKAALDELIKTEQGVDTTYANDFVDPESIKSKIATEQASRDKIKSKYEGEVETVTKKIEISSAKLKAEREKRKASLEKQEEARTEYGRLNSLILQYARTLADIQSKLDSIATNKAEIVPLEEKQKGLRKTAEVLKYFDRLFALEVKQMIVEQRIPILNQFVDEYMSILKDGMTAQFLPADKGLEVRIGGSSGSEFDMLSGGEQEALRLAVNMALGMTSADLNKDLPSMLFLDEIFGCLDQSTKEGTFALLNRLGESFEHILVITHDRLLMERFKRYIMIKKNNGISTIEVVK